MKKTDILDVLSRKLAPFILLFGLYLVSYGHLSPGGGFQGGVVIASGVVLLMLCRGVERVQNLFPLRRLTLIEAGALTVFLVMGGIGIIAAGHFLGIFLPVGRAGEIPSAGFILMLNVVIGLKVGAGISLICFYLLRDEP